MALAVARVRYWRTVHPVVKRELARWHLHAERIPDDELRRFALENLRDAVWHVEVAAMLATLAPRALRARVVEAVVALEIAYDYLDSLTEQPSADQLANGLALYSALADAVALTRADSDYYALNLHRDDAGYLRALVRACQDQFTAMPSSAAVVDAVSRTATSCAEAQVRAHVVGTLGEGQFATWAARVNATSLAWWEVAAGMCASVISMHALIAAAARPTTTRADATALVDLYLLACSATTLLDSLSDAEDDAIDASHSFISYYRCSAEATTRIAAVATAAADAAMAMPRDRHHHAMIVAGVAGFYLSSPAISGVDREQILSGLPVPIRRIARVVSAIFQFWRSRKD